jgi:hypothetical protein
VNVQAFEEWFTTSGPNFIEVRNFVFSFLLALFAMGSVAPRLTRADPALVSSEGDKTVIRVSQSFNVL